MQEATGAWEKEASYDKTAVQKVSKFLEKFGHLMMRRLTCRYIYYKLQRYVYLENHTSSTKSRVSRAVGIRRSLHEKDFSGIAFTLQEAFEVQEENEVVCVYMYD